MAHRSIARPFPAVDVPRPAWPREVVGRVPRGEELGRLLWRAGTAPFWLGSDVPAPALPAREEARPTGVGLAGEQVVATLDRLARRLWLQRAVHIVVRAAWLGLLVGSVWLLLELRGGPALDVDALVVVAAVTVVLGIGFAATQRPTRRQVARMLDRSFGLQERMATAVDHLGRDVPAGGERASVVYLQMADAANVVAEVRRHPSLGVRFPVRELVLAIACGLLMAALYFLRGVGGDIPPVASGTVPGFTPAAERPVAPDAELAAEGAELTDAPTVDEVRERAQRSNDAQRDLSVLGRALADHAVTRSAADAIQQGEYAEAADELRELADQADKLSPTARDELASDLDQAASQMSPGSGDLTQASQEAAEGLRQGQEAAQEGVRDLGEAVERAGSQVASQQELSQEMRRAQAAASAQQGQAGQQSGSGEGQPQTGEGEPQPGQGQPGAEGEPGQANQPGSQAGGQQGADSALQEGAPGAPGQPAPPGAPGQGSEGQQGGQPGEGQQGEQAGGEASGEGERSEAGGGAGSGESQDGASEGAPGEAAAGQEAGQGAPAEQRVTEGGGESAEPGEPVDVDATLQLPQTQGESGVQTSPDGGGTNRGSGAGVTAGSGSAVQGEVGASGPDSNRVPPDYRTVVERYFSDPEGP